MTVSWSTIKPHLVAVFVLFHVLSMLVTSLPQVPKKAMNESTWNDPTVQGEVDDWAKRLAMSPDELEKKAHGLAESLNAMRETLYTPFRPYVLATGTRQGWRMFVAPHKYPTRYMIEKKVSNKWSVLFEERSPEHNWNATLLSHPHLRASIFRYGWPGYSNDAARLCRYLANKAMTEDGQIDAIRCRYAKSKSPSATEAQKWQKARDKICKRERDSTRCFAMNRWVQWVQWVSSKESSRGVALARIIMSTSMALHMARVLYTGSYSLVWVDARFGGARASGSTWLDLFGGATPGVVLGTVIVCMCSSLMAALGFFTTPALLLAWLCYRTLIDLNADARGGPDMLAVNILFLLTFAHAGGAFSLDRKIRNVVDQSPRWPRYLLVFQMCLLYFATGVQKISSSWVPGGSADALWYVLQQPTWQRASMLWVAPFYFLTQIATLITWVWEVIAPVYFLSFLAHEYPESQSRFFVWLRKIYFREVFFLIGFILHASVESTLDVGPFFAGMMSLYAASLGNSPWPFRGGRKETPEAAANP